MDDQEARRPIADLERSDWAKSAYQPIVEALAADLMERTLTSTDNAEKVRLAYIRGLTGSGPTASRLKKLVHRQGKEFL